MIFNSEYTSYDNTVVTESPYPLGLEGALMHVWENECNYNAMMKAVGISELRYYQETGGDLFVQEAGAFSGFINKAKAFFKKVIEKIKQIFHKFTAVISQYTMDDKKFVKKYEKEIMRRDYTDFEVEGYTFDGLGTYAGDMKVKYDDAVTNAYGEIAKLLDEANANSHLTKNSTDSDYASKLDTFSGKDNSRYTGRSTYSADSDALTTKKENARRTYFNKLTSNNGTGGMESSEFSEELKEYLYGNGGDKDTIEIDNSKLRGYLEGIKKAEKDISYANRIEKKTTSEINAFIKRLEKIEGENVKYTSGETTDVTNKKNSYIKTINDVISVAQSVSNDVTVACGLLVQALKDRNRQAKAICVKALSYKNKNESATYTESYYDNDDIFANVVIR